MIEVTASRVAKLARRTARWIAMMALGWCLLVAGMLLLGVDPGNPIRVLAGILLVQVAGAVYWRA